jgi:putative endonuclease
MYPWIVIPNAPDFQRLQALQDPPYYWVYMIECSNGAYYTGYTKDILRRYREHRRGTANCRYTRVWPPVRIAQCWRVYDSRGTAIKIESLIKGRPRKVKVALVENPQGLSSMIADKLHLDVAVCPFDPARVEEALAAGAQRTDDGDPFADTPPEGDAGVAICTGRR